MRILFFLVWIFTSASMQAQTKLPAAELDYLQQAKQSKHSVVADSIIPQKKWFVTSYAGLASSFSFFKGGNATVLSVPLILQINHRLSNNLYAFAAVSAAPAYVNFSGNYNYMTPTKSGQQNNFMQSPSLGIYSKAELGLMYVNDAKTFSISASVGVSKSNYPMLPVYPLNTFGASPVFSSRR